MRYLLMSLSLLVLLLVPAAAQAQISLSINVETYPTLVRVPGYPVYYDPQLSSNYFFYDGLYWVYAGDTWYASSWYNGPWQTVGPQSVPLFVLRVPVRYYRQPPVYFRGWQADAPPRWGEHWGRGWEEHRAGWDHWDRHAVPPPAPLPVYQRQYTGDRYPRAPEQQHAIRVESYHYQPREVVTQQHYQQAPKAVSSQAEARPPPAPQHQQAAPPATHAEVRPPAPASTPQHAAPPPHQQAAQPPAHPAAPASAPQHAAPPPHQQAAQPAAHAPAPASTPQHAAPPPHQQAAQPAAHPPAAKPASAPQQHENKAPPPQKSEQNKGEQHGSEQK